MVGVIYNRYFFATFFVFQLLTLDEIICSDFYGKPTVQKDNGNKKEKRTFLSSG